MLQAYSRETNELTRKMPFDELLLRIFVLKQFVWCYINGSSFNSIRKEHKPWYERSDEILLVE